VELSFYNSLTRKDEVFTPYASDNVRMYVCGPTVYARAHLGNARSVVVYDVLYRLLRHVYGDAHVTFARNITDVDDKINAAAIENKESIQALTQRVTGWFHADMDALQCLRPTIEPRATEHIEEMRVMIEALVSNGHAYVAQDHVLFDVTSDADYGVLSGRKIEDQEAGARIAVESYKRHAGDFVLWKPADDEDDASSVFEGPFGIKGRPGWHIECSAMSTKHLGADFDIHGGGADLMFPHHENEIAQSCCANKGSSFAKLWIHNGFLTVNGEKMSKSLGNFLTVHDVLESGVQGEVIRLALLSSHYRKPLDWNDKLVEDAKKTLDGWYRKLTALPPTHAESDESHWQEFMAALADDLNVQKALSVMHKAATSALLQRMGDALGVLQGEASVWLKGGNNPQDDAEIAALIQARIDAKQAKNWTEADGIRNLLKEQGIILEDRPDGSTDWRRE
jgi:cysteinyl-tRNA synthetase